MLPAPEAGDFVDLILLYEDGLSVRYPSKLLPLQYRYSSNLYAKPVPTSQKNTVRCH